MNDFNARFLVNRHQNYNILWLFQFLDGKNITIPFHVDFRLKSYLCKKLENS